VILALELGIGLDLQALAICPIFLQWRHSVVQNLQSVAKCGALQKWQIDLVVPLTIGGLLCGSCGHLGYE